MEITDIELPLLREVAASPSAFDSYSNYMGDIPEPVWRCVLTRSRDSDCLAESNFRVALRELGGESEDVQIFRFGHWACGWWEALAVREDGDSYDKARELFVSLQDYPVLCEEDFSIHETEEADRVWQSCYRTKDRIDYIRGHRSQFDFYSWRDIRACVRGDYFGGYPSEIL
jgi:hypothetical protein